MKTINNTAAATAAIIMMFVSKSSSSLDISSSKLVEPADVVGDVGGDVVAMVVTGMKSHVND
jgi:hypothetical protein